MEAYGMEHKQEIIDGLGKKGYKPREVKAKGSLN